MNLRELFEYYSNENVLEQLLSSAGSREVSVAMREGGHMSRPNSLVYARDVLELVKRGAVSFHGTVEHWKNPLLLRTGMSPSELSRLRTGWDLIIDIDSAIGLEAAKLAALRVLGFLRSRGVEATVKFSGNRGFHVGVSWSAFPEQVDYEPTANQFPRLARILTSYVKECVKDKLFEDLKRLKGSVHELMEELGETQFVSLTPYMFVDIETNWGERHLFRLPYSLNEKTWLASLPVSPNELNSFRPEYASPEKAVRYEPRHFLKNGGKADELIVAAVDWHAAQTREAEKKPMPKKRHTKEVPETSFPPCIRLVMSGLSDGRKRSILVLINFLQQMNWPWEKIEAAVREANAKNSPPLPETYVNTQLAWFRRRAESGNKLLPPNCANEAFYVSYGVCRPDDVCRGGTNEIMIKNPAVYPYLGKWFKKEIKR